MGNRLVVAYCRQNLDTQYVSSFSSTFRADSPAAAFTTQTTSALR
jgi:hypothetical protein